jgi:hypothetical protein
VKYYIENLISKASQYRKANETFLKSFKVDDGQGGVKQNEEIIKIGSTDLKIKLTLQKIKYSSKAQSVKLDTCVIQFRPRAKEIHRYNEMKKLSSR